MDPFILDFPKDEVLNAIKEVGKNSHNVEKVFRFNENEYDLGLAERDIDVDDFTEMQVRYVKFVFLDSSSPDETNINLLFLDNYFARRYCYEIYLEVLYELGVDYGKYDKELKSRLRIEEIDSPFLLYLPKEEVFEAIINVSSNSDNVKRVYGYDEDKYEIGLAQKDKDVEEPQNEYVEHVLFKLSDFNNSPYATEVHVDYLNNGRGKKYCYDLYMEVIHELSLDSNEIDLDSDKYDNALKSALELEETVNPFLVNLPKDEVFQAIINAASSTGKVKKIYGYDEDKYEIGLAQKDIDVAEFQNEDVGHVLFKLSDFNKSPPVTKVHLDYMNTKNGKKYCYDRYIEVLHGICVNYEELCSDFKGYDEALESALGIEKRRVNWGVIIGGFINIAVGVSLMYLAHIYSGRSFYGKGSGFYSVGSGIIALIFLFSGITGIYHGLKS